MRHRILALATLIAAAALVGRPLRAADSAEGWMFMVHQSGGAVYQRYIVLPTAGTYRFRTYNLPTGMDTVLHVWNLATNQWMASNDDVAFAGSCGLLPPFPESLGSCVQLTVAGMTPVMVTVHRFANTTPAVSPCTFEAGRVGHAPLVSESIMPGGDVTRTFADPYTSHKVAWVQDDVFQFAFAGEGLHDSADTGLLRPLILLLSATTKLDNYDAHALPFADYGSGIWGQPNVRARASAGSVSPAIVVGRNYWTDCDLEAAGCGDGTGYYFRNDYLRHDADHDSLGDSLESYLGTEPENADSDFDGLRDDLEVVGGCAFYGCQPSSSDAINLRTYGGTPRTKDYFMQVDWMMANNPPASPPFAMPDLLSALEKVRETFASEASATDVAKPPIHMVFDRGQFAGLGGEPVQAHSIPYQTVMCASREAAPECLATASPWCAQANTFCDQTKPPECEDLQICSLLHHCVPKGCTGSCAQLPALHGPVPYTLEEVVRGGVGTRFLMPRNRRGLFAELFIRAQGTDSGNCGEPPSYESETACASYAFSGCKDFFPPVIVTFSVPAYPVHPAILFHEIGHTLGLNDTYGLPNHISNMDNGFDAAYVDKVGHLDYSSGNREVLRQWVPMDSPCADVSTCGDAAHFACLDGHCMRGGLDKTVGIGNLFAAGGNNYYDNQGYQLGMLKCMTNNRGTNGGIGPVPVLGWNETHPASIDWDKKGQETSTGVGANFFETCPGWDAGPTTTIFDVDEWATVTGMWGFRFFGMEWNRFVDPSWLEVPICSEDEQISCPISSPPYTCLRGICHRPN